jgi:transcriptional regulator with XRE-family HTH domain
MRNIKHILQSIKDYKGFKTNAQLAEYLGVSSSTLSNWVARNTLDENLIMSKIPEITLRFLRTGEYPMTEQHDVIGNLLKRIEYLERRLDRLEKEKTEG